MGNTTHSSSAPPSPTSTSINRENSVSKQVHISTNHADGFYFTGDRLTGTVRMPRSLLPNYLQNMSDTTSEVSSKRSLRNPIVIELVGEATYSADRDSAADSDGHVTHKVNLCRQCAIVTINQPRTELQMTCNNPPSSSKSSSTRRTKSTSLPSMVNGSFHFHIPEGLPPSLANNGTPSVVYTLELSLPSSRRRYQIPLILSSKGYMPSPTTDIKLTDSAANKNNISLKAHISKSFYQPGEQIPIQINYSNPQQRFIRSITVQLVEFYCVHHDQNYTVLDGKEWIFDNLSALPSTQWSAEVHLQLPHQPLPASYSMTAVGTTQTIHCDLHYRILIDLNEKKGDDINLTLAPIHVTYQK